jgi:TPR repeat protein
VILPTPIKNLKPDRCSNPADSELIAQNCERIAKRKRLLPEAQKGVPEAQYEYASTFNDPAITWKWYCLAANQRHSEAQYEVGHFYRYSTGSIGKNLTKSYLWYTLSANQGHSPAIRGKEELVQWMTVSQIAEGERLVAEWEPNPAECDEAPPGKTSRSKVSCVASLAEAVRLSAQAQLQQARNCSGRGLGPAVIWRWRCLAAHQGDDAAQSHVGHYYRVGSAPIQKELSEAYKWYSLAANNGDSRAGELLKKVSKQMTPGQVAEAERLVAEWEPNPAECEAIAERAIN